MFKKVLVTGGAGYVGAVLIPKLLNKGYQVKVLDLYIYGDDTLSGVKDNPNLIEIKGDIRDQDLLKKELAGIDGVVHLACISNDPTFELNPNLSRSINYNAFEPLVQISKDCGVKRFIYASTCSVYGVSNAPEVTEDHPLVPITDYNKYKGLCEPILLRYQSPDFTTVVIRPATVCGYSPRQRFDLTVNILTNHAFHKNKITVFGGSQTRPNIHIEDITDLYCMLLEFPDEKIAGKTFNAGYQNRSIEDIAGIVQTVMKENCQDKGPIEIIKESSDDPRSYRISSKKINQELNFIPKHTIEDAVYDLIEALNQGKLRDSMTDIRYYNIKTMQAVKLK
ncbi:MAG: SDR family oxidoreductase [Candidatus Omnitrophota bacterium]